jgi:hypothetical protein
MALVQSPLPTAWLAPPEGLLPSNHIIKIEPVPIAISATIAFVVGSVAIILFNRKEKDIFLEDHIISTSENELPAAIAGQFNDNRNDLPDTINAPHIQYPAPVREHCAGRQPGFCSQSKLDAVLGWKDNCGFEHNRIQLSPLERQPYHAPSRPQHDECESERGILNDYEKNSAYLPFPESAISDNSSRRGVDGHESLDRSQVSEYNPVNRRSLISLATKTRLGDAY